MGSLECDYCAKLFKYRSSLIAHRRSHTKERPFTCDKPGCSRTYCYKVDLNRHKRTHQGLLSRARSSQRSKSSNRKAGFPSKDLQQPSPATSGKRTADKKDEAAPKSTVPASKLLRTSSIANSESVRMHANSVGYNPSCFSNEQQHDVEHATKMQLHQTQQDTMMSHAHNAIRPHPVRAMPPPAMLLLFSRQEAQRTSSERSAQQQQQPSWGAVQERMQQHLVPWLRELNAMYMQWAPQKQFESVVHDQQQQGEYGYHHNDAHWWRSKS